MIRESKFRMMFRSGLETHRTHWYSKPSDASAALETRIGYFAPLGRVSGDVFENGVCTSAPRNGGLVTLHKATK